MKKDWVHFVCALSKQDVGSKGETVIDIGIDSCAVASIIPRRLLQLPFVVMDVKAQTTQ